VGRGEESAGLSHGPLCRAWWGTDEQGRVNKGISIEEMIGKELLEE
jgi:hypothetical protein